MRVTAITHKASPVFVSIISQVTPSESSVLKKVAMEPMFLTHLRDRLAVKGVRRVILHEPLSNLRKVIFVQYAQNTPRTEVWRGLHGAATLLADCGKICIAVSEDIDPSNADAVFWSLAYRSHPMEDVVITPYRRGVQGSQYGPGESESTMLIDATQKYPMAPLAWLSGVSWHDARPVGSLLGVKTVLNELIAYSEMKDRFAADPNFISPRSAVIAAYALCGFANFASVGIQVGGISTMAPTRRGDLSRLGLLAMIGGGITSLMTAAAVGVLL